MGSVTVLKFLQTLALDFPYLSAIFPRKFWSAGREIFTEKCIKKLKLVLAHVAACNGTHSNFFSRIVRGESLVYNSYIFFRTAVLRKLLNLKFSYKHCNFSRGCLLVKMASKAVIRPILHYSTFYTSLFRFFSAWEALLGAFTVLSH